MLSIYFGSPNTCGPSWRTCAEFDFERPESIAITPNNIRERAQTLLEQYKLKAEAFLHNNVLIPLGDDFKYKTLTMTREIFEPYQKLFDYMNNEPSLNVNIRFSTLSEYFDAVHRTQQQKELEFPIYYGDFFTYNDRDNDYWSGYFTTRPFFKALSRRAEAATSAAETLYALAKVYDKDAQFPWEDAFASIREARRSIGLFQHHDGITGTSKAYVVQDYATQLTTSLTNMKRLISSLSQTLLTTTTTTSTDFLTLVEQPPRNQNELPSSIPIDFSSSKVRLLVVHNPLPKRCLQTISVIVSHPQIRITTSNGTELPSQLNPVWNQPNQPFNDKFLLYFTVDLEPLGLNTFFLIKSTTVPTASLPQVSVFASNAASSGDSNGPFTITYSASPSDRDHLYIENDRIRVNFDAKGCLQSLTLKSGTTIQFGQDFMTYSTRRSGAYLFLPDGPANGISIPTDPTLQLIKGNLVQQLHVELTPIVAFTVTLYDSFDAGTYEFTFADKSSRRTASHGCCSI